VVPIDKLPAAVLLVEATLLAEKQAVLEYIRLRVRYFFLD
jgi:hypothetical protein